jgi:leucyl-tRNA synthetase
MNRYQAIQLARELRKNQTPEEKLMWHNLRNRKLDGKKFLRQHPIIYEEAFNNVSFFIADFYCHEHKLVLEIDGAIHNLQKDSDRQRDLIANQLGLKVLRIKNEEVNKNISAVLRKIRDAVK